MIQSHKNAGIAECLFQAIIGTASETGQESTPLTTVDSRPRNVPYSRLSEAEIPYMKFLPQIIITAAIIAVASGIMAFISQPSSGGVQITLPAPTPEQSREVGVYITGAVQFPGVYSLAEGDRLQQAVQAAGGPTADADLTAINLAARLSDEDHWHIPTLGEALSLAGPANADSTAVAGSPKIAGSPGLIDVNGADAELLRSLPGIGEVRANAILAFRETNGPFPTIDDLLAVNGIGPATLESIRDLIEAR